MTNVEEKDDMWIQDGDTFCKTHFLKEEDFLKCLNVVSNGGIEGIKMCLESEMMERNYKCRLHSSGPQLDVMGSVQKWVLLKIRGQRENRGRDF